MALFPCDRHGARYSGKQSTLYLAIGSSSDMDRIRLRLCGDCLDDVIERCDVLDRTMDNGMPQGDVQSAFECCRCNAAAETVAVFATVYRPGRDQDGWYGRMCPECAAEWRSGVVGVEPPTPSESRQKGH